MEYRKFPSFRKYVVAGMFSGAAIVSSIGLSYAQMAERLSPEECKRLEEAKDETTVSRNMVRGTRYGITAGSKVLINLIPSTDPRAGLAKATIYVLEKSCTIPMKYLAERPLDKKIDRLERTIKERCWPEDNREQGEYDGADLPGDVDSFNSGFIDMTDSLSGDLSGEAENACRDQYNPLEKIKKGTPAQTAILEKRPEFKKKYADSEPASLPDRTDVTGKGNGRPVKRSVNETNEILWSRHPGLGRRQLTKGDADREFGKEWIRIRDYNE